jgi:putative membrane protein
MRYAVLPTALLVLIVSCSPGNQRSSETGMAEGGAGGLSTRDTMPSTVDTVSFTRADSTAGTEAASAPAAILSEMNVANTTEVQLSTLAAKKARSPKVRQIAHKLADDHAQNREELWALAQKLNATLTPGQGGSVSAAGSAALPPDLRGKSGRDFDRAFIEHEINDHQSSIQRLQTQAIPSVQNADIKAYLQKTLKEMQSHLSMLKQVRKQLGS